MLVVHKTLFNICRGIFTRSEVIPSQAHASCHYGHMKRFLRCGEPTEWSKGKVSSVGFFFPRQRRIDRSSNLFIINIRIALKKKKFAFNSLSIYRIIIIYPEMPQNSPMHLPEMSFQVPGKKNSNPLTMETYGYNTYLYLWNIKPPG